MILTSPSVSREAFEHGTGWELKPQGACKGDACVPLRGMDPAAPDLARLAELLQMGLVHDDKNGLWALGPASGKALMSAAAPDLELPEYRGGTWSLRSLRGSKVFLLAWASW